MSRLNKTYWFKVHLSYLSDGRFMQFPEITRFHLWGLIGMVKSDNNFDGYIKTHDTLATIDDMACYLHSTKKAMTKSVELLLNNGYLFRVGDAGYGITDYNEDQSQSGSLEKDKEIDNTKKENNKLRQEKHRNNNKDKEIDKEIDKEKEEEKEEEGNTLVTCDRSVTRNSPLKPNNDFPLETKDYSSFSSVQLIDLIDSHFESCPNGEYEHVKEELQKTGINLDYYKKYNKDIFISKLLKILNIIDNNSGNTTHVSGVTPL
jgi:hypothetical protein